MPAVADEIRRPAGTHHSSRERHEHQDDERNSRSAREARIDGTRQHETRRKGDDNRADDEHGTEHEPVPNARMVRNPVRADTGKEQRNPRHHGTDDPRHRERPEYREPIAIEPEPDECSDDRQHDPHARVRQDRDDESGEQQQRPAQPRPPIVPRADRPQSERHGRSREQRQLVPVPERITQASKPLVVRIDPRDHLRRQRPHEQRAEQHARNRREAPQRHVRNERPHRCEREVHEATVRVVPRAARLDRPRDRHALPHHERSQGTEEHGAPERQPRTPPRPADRGHEYRRHPDPEDPRLARAVAEEERQERQPGGRGSPDDRPAHSARS